ncbi:uracil-DNA glycosylase family protein [Kordiimonas marina]|uniref:uracil-DNA glycosylase family protein n=1 Tax=Kordiimonas marina TaxID=2872312 RepID=UPI001FF28C4A|nr:uracil-DNA glycosylase family protein [Kordiimonas marina]MCJ9430168.1 uracil-DNA glycosylase family protein [Kordiimonas marina]
MPDLLARVRTCHACAGLPLGPKPILQADSHAKILIAGQAPGKRAHERGLPFDDPSGDRLRSWLGVSRDAFYDPHKFAILPMGFCFPGTGKGGDLPPRPECAPLWRQTLLDAMPQIRLTLVIGAYAQAWHLGAQRGRTLTETVGDWRAFWPDVIPLPHPSPRNQRWFKANPFFAADLVPVLQARVLELTSN